MRGAPGASVHQVRAICRSRVNVYRGVTGVFALDGRPLRFHPACCAARFSSDQVITSRGSVWGLSRNGVKNYSKGPCVTILE